LLSPDTRRVATIASPGAARRAGNGRSRADPAYTRLRIAETVREAIARALSEQHASRTTIERRPPRQWRDWIDTADADHRGPAQRIARRKAVPRGEVGPIVCRCTSGVTRFAHIVAAPHAGALTGRAAQGACRTALPPAADRVFQGQERLLQLFRARGPGRGRRLSGRALLPRHPYGTPTGDGIRMARPRGVVSRKLGRPLKERGRSCVSCTWR
jgi:hypothetical protein